jgi:hypothetical protein
MYKEAENCGPFLVWWCISVISALGRLRKEDQKFDFNLGYVESSRS